MFRTMKDSCSDYFEKTPLFETIIADMAPQIAKAVSTEFQETKLTNCHFHMHK